MRLEVEGAHLDYEVTGDGATVVFVHGSWSDKHEWDPVLPQFARRSRAVTYSRRGHSESTGSGDLQRDVSDVAALIEELGGAAHVVGNSSGAIVSLRLLVARPELVVSMAVHEPPLLGLLAGLAEWEPVLEVVNPRVGAVVELVASGRHAEAAERFVEEVALGPGQWALLPAERRDTLVRNAPTFLEETQDPSTYSLELAALKDVIVPVLISDGAQSPPFFGPIAQIVSKALGRATTYTFKEAGHVPHQTHPNEFVNVVGAFFSDAK